MKATEKQKAAMRGYYAKNRDAIRTRAKKYYKANKKKAIAQSRAWAIANAERVQEYQRQYRETHRDERVDYDLQRTYGITLAEYDTILASQGGACAICGQPQGSQRLSVDHDHATGRVRGLLCKHCNMAIGQMGDSPSRLRAAAQYIEHHQEV